MDPLTVATWRLPRASLATVEAATIPPDERAARLRDVMAAAGSDELVFLATCQRVVLVLAGGDAPTSAAQALEKGVGKPLEPPEVFRAWAAFAHLAEVASSLDSLVPGEPQVLGQVKQAVAECSQAGLCGATLRHVFDHVFQAAKAVRSETDLFRGKVSVLPLTDQLVEERVRQAGRRARVAVLGTGAMGLGLASRLRAGAPDAEVVLVSRSPALADALAARLDHPVLDLARFLDGSGTYDIVACAMEASAPLVGLAQLERLRRGDDLLVLDLAVPRNVAVEATPAWLRLVTLDDLAEVSRAGLQQRMDEVAPARRVLEREIARIQQEYEERKLAHVLAELVRRFDAVAAKRLEQAPGDLALDPAFAKWHAQTVRALLHEATTAVKEVGCRTP